mmetsp:Transcript_32840/g.50173  ORF Transcript_32840/g.50173 Transcript_32840/m.50173 type:complete len:207 (-) Transcript_32840:1186-1806(-)
MDEFLNFRQRVFTRVLLEDSQSLAKILTFLGELEHLCVLVVDLLRLALDGLSEREVTLEHLLHHVDGVHYALGDRVFRLVSRAVRLERVLLPLVASDVLELVSLLFEELVNFLLVLHDALRDYLPPFNDRALSRVTRRVPVVLRLRLLGHRRPCRIWTDRLLFSLGRHWWFRGQLLLRALLVVFFQLCRVLLGELRQEVDGLVGLC